MASIWWVMRTVSCMSLVGDAILQSIVTIQFDLRPFWTELKPSKICVKTPFEPNSEGHQTKTNPTFEKNGSTSFIYWPILNESPMTLGISHWMKEEIGFEIVDFREYNWMTLKVISLELSHRSLSIPLMSMWVRWVALWTDVRTYRHLDWFY